MPENLDFSGAVPPGKITEPCWRFFEDWHRVQRFGAFVSGMAHIADTCLGSRTTFLCDDLDHRDQYQFAVRAIREGGGACNLLRAHNPMYLQMSLTRTVDSFLTYIAQLMGLIFETVPEILRSSKTVTHEEVMEHGTIQELIASIAEKRVHELAYKGMEQLSRELEGIPFRFKLFDDDGNLRRAIQVVEYRNLIVHNRGVVNNLIRSRLPDLHIDVGQAIELGFDQVWSDVLFLASSVGDIDQRAGQRWDLPRQSDWVSTPLQMGGPQATP